MYFSQDVGSFFVISKNKQLCECVYMHTKNIKDRAKKLASLSDENKDGLIME